MIHSDRLRRLRAATSITYVTPVRHGSVEEELIDNARPDLVPLVVHDPGPRMGLRGLVSRDPDLFTRLRRAQPPPGSPDPGKESGSRDTSRGTSREDCAPPCPLEASVRGAHQDPLVTSRSKRWRPRGKWRDSRPSGGFLQLGHRLDSAERYGLVSSSGCPLLLVCPGFRVRRSCTIMQLRARSRGLIEAAVKASAGRWPARSAERVPLKDGPAGVRSAPRRRTFFHCSWPESANAPGSLGAAGVTAGRVRCGR